MTTKKSTAKGGRTTPSKKDQAEAVIAAYEPPPWDAAVMLEAKEPVTLDVTICLKSSLAEARLAQKVAMDAAEEELTTAKLLLQSFTAAAGGDTASHLDGLDDVEAIKFQAAVSAGTTRLETALAARNEAVEAYNTANKIATAQSVKFVFADAGRKKLDEWMMKPEHRPSKKSQDDFRNRCNAEGIEYKPLEFDQETFAPFLIAKTCIEPELTFDQAKTIWEDWGDAEAAVIFQTCWSASKLVQ